jgi:actin
MDEEVTAVCIDNGSGNIKAGFAGEEAPRTVFPTFVGKPTKPNNEKEFYVGRDAIAKQGAGLHMSQPIDKGIVTNWDDMEKIWDYTFSHELQVKP